MTSGSIVIAAAIVLLGCMVLRGINPFSAAIEAIVWLLYRASAITLALAKTTDAALLRLKWEYRTAVGEMNANRKAMLESEKQQLAANARRVETQSLRLVPNQFPIDDLSPAAGIRHGA